MTFSILDHQIKLLFKTQTSTVWTASADLTLAKQVYKKRQVSDLVRKKQLKMILAARAGQTSIFLARKSKLNFRWTLQPLILRKFLTIPKKDKKELVA